MPIDDELDFSTALEPEVVKVADNNPAVKQSNDALKIAKVLADLLNTLAGLDQTSREQIAQAAGLQQLPEAIDKLYEYSDQVRAGGVTNLQTAYAGFDPDKLMKQAKPFVSLIPAPTVVEEPEPEQVFQNPNTQTKTPHEPEVLLDKP